ncbi:hypothetical protein [Streptomyces sp. NPDC020983]|uniref:hypothetical protein n=1 Tax=Streptomyces sp. NPDC020983 TaxID=3365106 RepID=UPI0037B9A02E
MGDTAGNRGRRVARGCAFTVFCAVGVVMLLLLGGMWYIHEQLKPPAPPDVAAFAHSAAARTAEAGAARAASADLAALTSAVPWAEPVGTSVSDVCRSVVSSAMFGSRARWSSTGCTRSTVAYVAFDGDIGSRLRSLDAVLGAQGWTGEGAPPATLARAAAGDPAAPAPSPGGASSSPGAPSPGWGRVSVLYTARPSAAIGDDTSPYLRVSVAGAPYDPQAITGDQQSAGSPPRRDTDQATVYVSWQPLSTHAVAQSAFAAHRYVAAFSLVAHYLVDSPPATATRSATPTTYDPGPCLSGSHTCS